MELWRCWKEGVVVTSQALITTIIEALRVAEKSKSIQILYVNLRWKFQSSACTYCDRDGLEYTCPQKSRTEYLLD